MNYYQCQNCGHIHKDDDNFNIEDDLFIEKQCPKCRGRTSHLWVGDKKDDIYMYMNINADPRFYNYKTK